MLRNFKLLSPPLDGGGWVGVKEKATHPPFVPPIKGGIIFNSCSRRMPNLMFRKFKIKSRMGQSKQTHRPLTYLFIDGCAPVSPILHDCYYSSNRKKSLGFVF